MFSLLLILLTVAVQGTYQWYNWQLDMTCTATGEYCPESEDALVDWVKQKYRIRALMKVVGRGHVFGNITTCISVDDTARESWVIRLDELTDITVDQRAKTATVGAGWTLNALVEYLDKNYHLTVLNTGTERVQNFVGAITTGTHGTGKFLGNMATPVLSMKLLMANGSFLTIDQDHYYGARITLGALGIITEVTVQLTDITYLHRVDSALEFVNLTDFYRRVQLLSEQYDRFQVKDLELTWDTVRHVWVPAKYARITTWVNTTITNVENCSTIILCCGDCYPSNCIDKNYAAIAAPIQGHECGPSFFAEFEHIVPINKNAPNDFFDLVIDYTNYFNSIDMTRVEEIFDVFNGTQGKIALRVPELRFVKADDIWMSEANSYGLSNVSYFGIVNVDLKMPFSNWETLNIYLDFLNKFIPKYGTQYNVRPHWGKLSDFNLTYTSFAYPMVRQFLALRSQTDPNCQFINRFLLKALGLESQCGSILDLNEQIPTTTITPTTSNAIRSLASLGVALSVFFFVLLL